MIAQATASPKQRARFLRACAGKPYFGSVLPVHLALFGRSQPGRFFAGPSLAVELGQTSASVAGHCAPEELASFLQLCGPRSVMMEPGPAPAGWRWERAHFVFSLAPGGALRWPDADEVLWRSLALNGEPSPSRVADALFRAHNAWRDDFYAELCAKRNHGAARIWTLEREGEIVCTVGAYALHGGQAYLACGETQEALRGHGIGGRLIVQAANQLAAEGWRVTLLCGGERVHFYTRLGFARQGELARYTAPEK